jgi:hypothetical protein
MLIPRRCRATAGGHARAFIADEFSFPGIAPRSTRSHRAQRGPADAHAVQPPHPAASAGLVDSVLHLRRRRDRRGLSRSGISAPGCRSPEEGPGRRDWHRARARGSGTRLRRIAASPPGSVLKRVQPHHQADDHDEKSDRCASPASNRTIVPMRCPAAALLPKEGLPRIHDVPPRNDSVKSSLSKFNANSSLLVCPERRFGGKGGALAATGQNARMGHRRSVLPNSAAKPVCGTWPLGCGAPAAPPNGPSPGISPSGHRRPRHRFDRTWD